MLNDRDSLLRRLHELRSEHRDLDTVIARLSEAGPIDLSAIGTRSTEPRATAPHGSPRRQQK